MNAAVNLLRLDPELTIYGAAALKARLLDAFAGGASLVLDLGDVCEVDSAGIQLLLAAQRHAAAAGGQLTLQNQSPAIADAFSLLGLEGAMP